MNSYNYNLPNNQTNGHYSSQNSTDHHYGIYNFNNSNNTQPSAPPVDWKYDVTPEQFKAVSDKLISFAQKIAQDILPKTNRTTSTSTRSTVENNSPSNLGSHIVYFIGYFNGVNQASRSSTNTTVYISNNNYNNNYNNNRSNYSSTHSSPATRRNQGNVISSNESQNTNKANDTAVLVVIFLVAAVALGVSTWVIGLKMGEKETAKDEKHEFKRLVNNDWFQVKDPKQACIETKYRASRQKIIECHETIIARTNQIMKRQLNSFRIAILLTGIVAGGAIVAMGGALAGSVIVLKVSAIITVTGIALLILKKAYESASQSNIRAARQIIINIDEINTIHSPLLV